MSIGIVLPALQMVPVTLVSAFERKFKIHGNIVYSKHTDSVSWIWLVGASLYYSARIYSPDKIGATKRRYIASLSSSVQYCTVI